MADIFLIVVTVVTFLILLVMGTYLIIHYQHPDDHNDAYFPKLTVLLGFVIAGATVLLLPLDVANNEGYAGCDGYDTKLCGGLNMELFWNIMYWLIPIWVFFLIPFMTFYYEADDGMLMAGTAVGGTPKSRLKSACCYQIGVFIVVGLVFTLCYLFLSETAIPVREYNGTSVGEAAKYETQPPLESFNVNQLANYGPQDRAVLQGNTKNEDMGSIEIRVDVATFFAGFMAFIGWFFFAIFGGIGISSMPLDLILNFVNRPRHMSPVEFAEAQMSIRERVNELVDIGELLKIERDEKAQQETKGGFFERRKVANADKKTLNQFKAAVYLLEQDVDDFQSCSANYANYNPLIPFFSLLFGIIAAVVSIFWILHIILYVLPPKNPVTGFLNNYFRWFDNWFPLFGTLSVAIFTVYLLLASLKGCFKFGLRFFWFQVHPMKINRTYMSSFMFNIGLVLLCALPVVQFCTTAFADYARYATVNQVFGTQIQYLKFFKWFWTNNVFVYALLVITVLTSLYLWCRPRDKSATNSLELRDRLKGRRG